ncbi:MAG: tRNA (adenosine(37)-N6)-threonylcarbamoyltransferase complex transferase subunit TsaD [Chitinophagales bacterium]|nr:tRNA (adenosine(37)-N6)-threonylcarbamoyltransferase complex transferase subunit TsaD [Chitinophagales bacterium]
MPTVILGIESSCDDTAASICEDGKILSNITASQRVHEQWGGVFPEHASRAHLINIIPVVHAAVTSAGKKLTEINAVAFTRGPGLIGSLLVGTSFAKGLSLSLHVPLIDVNHIHAHIMALFIEHNPSFPFLCLSVSGGHTQLILVHSHHSMEIVGQTTDDAAGEAFDKIAKMFGLPYPGGHLIDKYASMGNPHAFHFTVPKAPLLNYSFSGLKTSVLYFIRKMEKSDPDFISRNLNDLCASVQYTIVESLIFKLEQAIQSTKVQHIALAGGVSANSLLRKRFNDVAQKYGINSYIPRMEYCTDNAAMIAIAGYFKYNSGMFCSLDAEAVARWPI